MYLVRCLAASGVDIGHESMAGDGIVCGFWALDAERAVVDKTRPCDYSWEVLSVIVRHPLLVAETLPHFMRGRTSWSWSLPTDLVFHSLRFWVESHTAALALGIEKRIRVDSHFWDDYCIVCDMLRVDVRVPGVGPASKSARWPRTSWEHWMERDPAYCRRGRALVNLYELEEPLPGVR